MYTHALLSFLLSTLHALLPPYLPLFLLHHKHLHQTTISQIEAAQALTGTFLGTYIATSFQNRKKTLVIAVIASTAILACIQGTALQNAGWIAVCVVTAGGVSAGKLTVHHTYTQLRN